MSDNGLVTILGGTVQTDVFDSLPRFDSLRLEEKSALLQCPLFNNLDEKGQVQFFIKLKIIDLRKNQILFTENDRSDRVYFILDGMLKLGYRSSDGREILIGVVGRSELIGESAALDIGPRNLTVTSLSRCKLAWIPCEEFKDFVENHIEMSRSLMRILVQRNRHSNAKLASLVFSDVPARIARTLLDLGERFGESNSEGIKVSHQLTQQELAQLVGASRETVNKALSEFSERGWINLGIRSVVLKDLERLAKRAR